MEAWTQKRQSPDGVAFFVSMHLVCLSHWKWSSCCILLFLNTYTRCQFCSTHDVEACLKDDIVTNDVSCLTSDTVITQK